MSYVPDRGDIVWTDFDPQAGHEQAGTRPALVLSRATFNDSSGLAICCPITGRQKGYPFEVPLPAGLDVYGVILVDHAKSLDWRFRQVQYVASAPENIMKLVTAKLKTLIE